MINSFIKSVFYTIFCWFLPAKPVEWRSGKKKESTVLHWLSRSIYSYFYCVEALNESSHHIVVYYYVLYSDQAAHVPFCRSILLQYHISQVHERARERGRRVGLLCVCVYTLWRIEITYGISSCVHMRGRRARSCTHACDWCLRMRGNNLLYIV